MNFEARATRRSDALARYRILDTPRERGFDDLAALASEICQTPIAVVNLVGRDRQWFKAEVGLGIDKTPLETSFCGTAILQDDFMLVPDARLDPRFACNPLVTAENGLRFYAGALLKTAEGVPIGTLCVLDHVPRTLSDMQERALGRLARQVMAQLDLRLALIAREEDNAELERRVEERARELARVRSERDRAWAQSQDLLAIANPDGRLDSTPGEGSVFTLYLPRADPDVADLTTNQREEQRANGQGICVLVVEDNAQVGQFATAALMELGYNSRLATDAAQALSMLESDASGIHVVFSDVVMPGMDGVDLAREIRRLRPEIPVILASGYSHILAQDGSHGFELLHKPYSIEQLSCVLRKATASRAGSIDL